PREREQGQARESSGFAWPNKSHGRGPKAIQSNISPNSGTKRAPGAKLRVPPGDPGRRDAVRTTGRREIRDLMTFGGAARTHWALAEDLTFLNHGSFGAVPLELLERSAALRRELERNPVAAIWRDGFPAIRRAAAQAAAFVGAPPHSTGFVTNATAGLNAVLASLPLEPGDELLHLDHGYFAVWQTLRVTARRRSVEIRQVPLPLPLTGPQPIIHTLIDPIGPRTRVIVLDQITSPTALVMPTAEIVARATARGVEVVLDGAHTPGMLAHPAAIAPQAAAWTGNLHKWPCALRGCALLSVRPDL